MSWISNDPGREADHENLVKTNTSSGAEDNVDEDDTYEDDYEYDRGGEGGLAAVREAGLSIHSLPCTRVHAHDDVRAAQLWWCTW